MMTTFRVAARSLLASSLVSPLNAAILGCPERRPGCALLAKDTLELAQIPDLELWWRHALRQGRRLAVDPGRGHAHALGAHHIDVRPVAHEERLARADGQPAQRELEYDGLGLAPAHLVGYHDGVEEVCHPFPFEDMPRRRRVIEVRHYREPVALSESTQELAVVLGEDHGLRELAHVGSQQ